MKLSEVKKYNNLQTIIGQSAAIINTNIYAYDNRNEVRSLDGSSGNLIFIESLGLFKYYPDSAELDDDETCFVNTTNGRWIVECPHWDLIDANSTWDDHIRDERLGDIKTILISTISNNFTSIANDTQATLTATITGAQMGDAVLVTPHNNLVSGISLYAYVRAANTVEVLINNTTANNITLTVGTWTISVFSKY